MVYDKDYRIYQASRSTPIPGTATGFDDDNDDLEEELARIAERQVNAPRKAYVPPTEVNADSPLPFGDVLDPPVG